MGCAHHRSEISSERLLNLVHEKLEWVAAGAALILIIHCCCLPLGSTVTAGPVPAPAAVDVIQNVLLYAPLGFCLALGWRRAGRRWGGILVFTLVASAAISGTIEWAQSLLPGRVCSRWDVASNTVGAATGAIMAYLMRAWTYSFRRRLRERIRCQPVFMSYLLGVAVFFGMSLIPFGFNPPPHRGESLLNVARFAGMTPAVAAQRVPPEAVARVRCELATCMAATTAVFVALGFLATWSLRREFEFAVPGSAALLAWMTLLVAGTAAIAGAIVGGAELQPAAVTAGLVGSAIGWVAGCCTGHDDPIRAIAALFRPAALGCIGIILAYELSPFEFDFSGPQVGEQLRRAGWLPLRKYFTASDTLIPAGDILAKFGRFFVLGILLAGARSAQRCLAPMRTIRRGIALGLILAVVIEIVQIGCPQRSVDITHVLAATTGAAAGLIAMQWWLELTLAVQSRRRKTPPGHLLLTCGGGRP